MSSLSNPATDYVPVTPSDTVVLPTFSGIYVGTAGDITLMRRSGTTATFKNLAVGEHPISGTQIMATGTTASDLLALLN